MAQAKHAVPEGYHTVTPVLTLYDCNAAIDWYVRALGAVEISRSPGPDGKLMHAEFRIGNSNIMAHDTIMDGKGPKGSGGSPAALWLFVDDCDALFNRAVAAGAAVVRPVMDQFWGDRSGTLKDPHGYAWTISTRKEDLSRQELEARAAEFFKMMAQGGPPKQ